MPCYLVAYDIALNRNRDAVARMLSRRGRRLQKSVFMLDCGRGAFSRLERELQENLAETDSLLFIPLCGRCLEDAKFWGELPEKLLIY